MTSFPTLDDVGDVAGKRVLVRVDLNVPIHWITDGFRAVDQLIGDDGYCFGSRPGLADLYLIPQVYSARRFNVPLQAYPRILRVDALAAAHPAFIAAHPARQADAE